MNSILASKVVPSEKQLEQFRKRISDLEQTRVRTIINF